MSRFLYRHQTDNIEVLFIRIYFKFHPDWDLFLLFHSRVVVVVVDRWENIFQAAEIPNISSRVLLLACMQILPGKKRIS